MPFFLRAEQQVVGDGRADENEQHEQELALLNQVGLARLEDGVGDAEHGPMCGLLFDLDELVQADRQGPDDDPGTVEEQVPRGDPAQVRK